jgi:hypothetical protein
MIHVSTRCNECFHTTGAHYLNPDATAFMQCLTSDLFKDFPPLKFPSPHGGGAVPYHWGRFRGQPVRESEACNPRRQCETRVLPPRCSPESERKVK